MDKMNAAIGADVAEIKKDFAEIASYVNEYETFIERALDNDDSVEVPDKIPVKWQKYLVVSIHHICCLCMRPLVLAVIDAENNVLLLPPIIINFLTQQNGMFISE